MADNDYLLPGPIDLHAHYRVSFQNLAHDATVAMPKIFLTNGVTATFPTGEIEPFKMKDLREQIDRGDRPGPHILSTGPHYGASASEWSNDFTKESTDGSVFGQKMGRGDSKPKTLQYRIYKPSLSEPISMASLLPAI
ncbi:MAG: hypothetical protein ACI9ZX_002759 [Algoriphagus sp.]|jgi:hypothetical protein